MGPVYAADLEVVQKLDSAAPVYVPWARVSHLAKKWKVLIYDINYKESWWDEALKENEGLRKQESRVD